MNISIKYKLLRLPENNTSLRATIVKNLMFLNAQITASVKNKQAKVFQSKYVRYSLSGGTKKLVAIAAIAATQNTVFFFINLKTAIRMPSFNYLFNIAYYITNTHQQQVLFSNFFLDKNKKTLTYHKSFAKLSSRLFAYAKIHPPHR